MANNQKGQLPEPKWDNQFPQDEREYLYGFGFTDRDIDAANAVPMHRFFLQMNATFEKGRDEQKEKAESKLRTSLTQAMEDKVGEVLTPWYAKLEEILDNQKTISNSITDIKDIVAKHEKRLEKLEITASSHDIIIAGHNKIIEAHNDLIRRFKRERFISKLQWAAVTVAISTGIILLIHRLLLS
jgi:hypothetical protein